MYLKLELTRIVWSLAPGYWPLLIAAIPHHFENSLLLANL